MNDDLLAQSQAIQLVSLTFITRIAGLPYLELAVIYALHGRWAGNLAANVVTVLEFIRDQITATRFIDPANTNNIVSDTVSMSGKQTLATAARATLTSSWRAEFA